MRITLGDIASRALLPEELPHSVFARQCQLELRGGFAPANKLGHRHPYQPYAHSHRIHRANQPHAESRSLSWVVIGVATVRLRVISWKPAYLTFTVTVWP